MSYKRYLIFTFSDYYPSGGLSDVAASFDTIEEAKKAITDSSIHISLDSCYVWDRITGETIFDLYE